MHPIEQVVQGDSVWAYHEGTRKNNWEVVSHTFHKNAVQLHRLIVGIDTIVATGEHPFYAGGAWIAAKELQVGMQVNAAVGVATVSAHQVFDSTATMYNFTVANAHTYHVGRLGLLVHNDCERVADALRLIADDGVRNALITDLKASPALTHFR